MLVKPIVLEGKQIRLEPLTMAHFEPLCQVGLDPAIWEWDRSPIYTQDEMKRYIELAIGYQAEGETLPFTILEKASNTYIGSTRFAYICTENRHLEIGWTWLGLKWQGTGIHTEAKYLMLRHAFETMGCIRVQFKTDERNIRSRKALEKLGAKEEGIFRNHLILPNGRVRNSVYYSIIEAEWPQVKQRLEQGNS